MSPIKTTPRFLAALALEKVLYDDAFSGVALNQILNQNHLQGANRALATEIFYGVLRWKTALESAVQKACKKPGSKIHKKIRAHLLVAAYQLHHLTERIPAFAAINEGVACIKKVKPPLAGFANAILRNLPPAPHLELNKDASLKTLCTAFSFAPDILAPWLQRESTRDPVQVCEQLNARPDLTLRAQGSLLEIEHWYEAMQQKAKRFEKHPWCPNAFTLEAGGDIRQLPGYEEGRFWVQDAASQACALLCAVQPGMMVMDLCAAPGGKSLILQSQLGPNDPVHSVEISAHKEARMLENSQRMQLPIKPIIADVLDLAQEAQWQHRADIILLDAPCSATGTFRRHPEIKWQKSIQNAQAAQPLQKELLNAARQLLKPQGRIIYSVCSPFKEEGPDVITEFLSQHPNFKVESGNAHVSFLPTTALTPEGYVSFLPHEHQADAFFIAVLKNQDQ